MKHFPAHRFHPQLAGLSTSRAPVARGRGLLVAAVCYAAGFFTGAILFGELLLTQFSR